MFKAFFTLGIAVAVIALSLYLVKRLVIKKNVSNSGLELKILSRISLQPKTHLYIIKADEKTLLVGATDHNINLISDLTEDPTFNETISIEENKALSHDFAKQMLSDEKKKMELEQNLSFTSFLISAFKKTN